MTRPPASPSKPSARRSPPCSPTSPALRPERKAPSRRGPPVNWDHTGDLRCVPSKGSNMVDVRRVKLPGVGVLHTFVTDDGGKVGVITHRSGHSDLISFSDAEDGADVKK